MMIAVSKILECARNSKIIVVGDVLLDAYDFCYTEHSRPSPECPDRKVYTAHRTEKLLGGAGNVAANLAALGVHTGLISLCGNDGSYFDVKRLCDEAGIEHVLVRDETRPTPVKTRLYIDDEYYLRRDDEKVHKVDRKIARKIREIFLRMLDHVDAVILSDYNKGVFTEDDSQELIHLCRERDIPVIVDFKPPNRSYFHYATVVAPNLIEAGVLVPDFEEENPLSGLEALHDQLGAENIIVTLGARGMVSYDGSTMHKIMGRSVVSVDPCGCGDTVRACLTLGLVSGLSLIDAAEFANYAASLVVQKQGTATLSVEEILRGAYL